MRLPGSPTRSASRQETPLQETPLSKRLPQGNVPDASAFEAARRQLAPVELETEIEADGPDRRADPDAETGRGTQVPEAELSGPSHDVASIQEPHPLEPLRHSHAPLGVQADHAVAPGGASA